MAETTQEAIRTFVHIVCTRHQAQAADVVMGKEAKGKNNPENVARRWIEFYRDKVMPESPCTDVEGLISLFEHDRAHYGKMIATLLPALGMLTGGPQARLLSPDPADIDDLRPCTHTANLIEQNKVMYFVLNSLSDPMVGNLSGCFQLWPG